MIVSATRLRADAAATAPVNASAPGPAPLIDRRACAHALGVSPATINRLVRAGRLPCRIVGNSTHFDLAAVIAALRNDDAASSSMATKAEEFVQAADAWMGAQGIERPSRMVDVFAPWFPRRGDERALLSG